MDYCIVNELTDEERLSCYNTVREIFRIQMIGKKEGVFHFEIIAENYDININKEFMINRGLVLISEGCHPEVFQCIMTNYMLNAKLNNKERFEALLISKGLYTILIAAGEGGYGELFLYETLASCFCFKFYKEFKSKIELPSNT